MNERTSLATMRDHLRNLLVAAAATPAPSPDALIASALQLHAAGDAEAALAAFEAALALTPERVSLWHAVATLRFVLDRPRAALAACEAALQREPMNPDSLFNLAVALERLGDRAAAELRYQQVLGIDPWHLGALLNQTALQIAEKRIPVALMLSAEAIDKHPDSADCWFNRGEALTSAGRHDEARIAYEQAFALQPSCVKADIAAAIAMAAAGHLAAAAARLDAISRRAPDAVAAFRSPLETDRESAYPELEPGRIAVISAYHRHRLCDWDDRQRFITLFRQVVDGVGCKPLDNPDLPFLGIGLPLSGDVRLRAARQVACRIVADVARCAPPLRPSRAHDSRLRIGYISGDFRRHATAWLMRQLPALHDRSRFEVFVFSSGPDDGSDVRRAIAAGADHFADVSHFDAATVAQRIALAGVDILVDLSGYTLHAPTAALALRPAPLQVSYLAYLQSSGAPWIDYALLDRHVMTDAERPFWDERIAYLPDTLYLCDDSPFDAALAGSRAAAGLPEEAFVYCCLNAPWKIDPDTFACWMAILQRVPSSVLWLYDDSGGAAAFLRAAAVAAGVDPSRLVFAHGVEHERHLARFVHADLFLDTFTCNAHTTAIEALAAGVPVLTLPGETVVSRVGASLLRAHGIDELVACSRAHYVALACELAEDEARHAALCARIVRRDSSRLFATTRRAREIEQAYALMWARHRAGLPPTDFDVSGAMTGCP